MLGTFSNDIATSMEENLVEKWLRRDPVRWIAGGMAGVFAGAVAMGLAMVLASCAGMEIWFPVKLIGTVLLGASATEMGGAAGGIVAGSMVIGVLGALLGFVFSHFTYTNSIKALLAMGLVWGTFSWIFIWNLFLPSFKTIFAAQIPAGPVLPVCLIFGLALSSVAFFDRKLRC